MKETTILSLVIANIVKDKKFGFRSKENGVGHARTLQVANRFFRDVARIATVILSRDWVLDIADHVQRGQLRERIQENSRRIGHE